MEENSNKKKEGKEEPKSIKLQIRRYNYVFGSAGINFKGIREERKKFHRNLTGPSMLARVTPPERERLTTLNAVVDGEFW